MSDVISRRRFGGVVLGGAAAVPWLPGHPAAGQYAPIPGFGQHIEAINVTDYGAVGDGVTDNVAAINAAIAAAPVGGSVYFPPGVYCVSQTITIAKVGLMVFGEGSSIRTTNTWGSVIKACDSMADVVVWTASQGGMHMMTADGNELATNTLNVTGNDFKMYHSVARGGLSKTLSISGSRPVVAQCAVDPRENGVGAVFEVGMADAIVSDCRFLEAGIRALQVSGTGNQFVNCHINGIPAGTHAELVLVDNLGNIFTGCYFDTGGEPGLRVSAAQTKLTGCRITRGDGNNPAIVIESGIQSLLVGNSIGTAAEPWAYGVNLHGGSGSQAVFADNIVYATAGLYLGSRPDVLRGNIRIDPVTSAKTYDMNSGVASVSNGATVSHGLIGLPRSVVATAGTNNPRHVSVYNVNSTTFTVGLWDSAGAAIATAERIRWYAEA